MSADILAGLMEAARERGRRPFQTIPLKDSVGRVASARVPGVIEEGERVETRHVLALAALGIGRPAVRVRPRAAFLTTGAGLVDFERRPEPGQVRDSAAPYLALELERLGCQLIAQGRAGDDSAALAEKLEELLDQDLDLIVTTGGLEGPVPAAVTKLGGELLFKEASCLGARFGHGPLLLSLPADPQAAAQGLERLGAPVLRWMLGETP